MQLASANLQYTREKALLAMLVEKYPPLQVTPRSTMEEIQYRAGQQSIIEAVYAFLQQEVERPNRLTAAEQRQLR